MSSLRIASLLCVLLLCVYPLPSVISLSLPGVIAVRVQRAQQQQQQQQQQHHRGSSSTTCLFGSNHLAARYGGFLDSLPRKRPKKMEEAAERLQISDETVEGLETGDDLRRKRNRNLKEVKEVQGPVPNLQAPEKERNWSEEEIAAAIECLNRSYDKRSREELSDEQRIGVIDWSLFELHAEDLIEGFTTTQKVRTKVIGWINFHRKKKDIRFEHDTWVWDPLGSDKRGKDKRAFYARHGRAQAKKTAEKAVIKARAAK